MPEHQVTSKSRVHRSFMRFSGPAAEERAFEKKPLEAAANAKLFPNEELESQHQRLCERAYALWEREGYPEGKTDKSSTIAPLCISGMRRVPPIDCLRDQA